MKFLALLLALSAIATCQISVEFSPERMPSELNAKNLYPWSVRMCSDSTTARELAPERIYMASGAIQVVDPRRVKLALLAAPKRSKKAIAATLLAEGATTGMMLTGFGAIAASANVVASLGTAGNIANRVSKFLESRVVDPGPYLVDLLDSAVILPPGGCATRTVYSGKMKKSQVRKVRSTIP